MKGLAIKRLKIVILQRWELSIKGESYLLYVQSALLFSKYLLTEVNAEMPWKPLMHHPPFFCVWGLPG